MNDRGSITQGDEPGGSVERRTEAVLPPKEVIEATAERCRRSEAERRVTVAKVKARISPLHLDTKERAAKRLARLGVDDVRFERIIGKTNLIEVHTLERGAKVARAVGRVRIRNAARRLVGSGTGVMVSPHLLITNNHVLASSAVAASSQIEFNYQDGPDGRPLAPIVFDFAPDRFFFTDRALDFTLVAVIAHPDAREPLDAFGWCPLKPEEGKVLKGEYLNIIQHPNGGPKLAALRENRLTALLEDFLHYETDTAPGSSGSPVFSDQWEMVALHHSGVPATDDQGRYLAIGGGLWSPELGEHRLQWIANEGVRVSRIVARLGLEQLTGEPKELCDELLAAEIRNGPSERTPREPPQIGPPSSAQSPALEGPVVRNDAATWILPLRVTVQLGDGASAPRVETPRIEAPPTEPRPPATRRGDELPPALRATLDDALRDLEASKKRAYYDRKLDRQDREEYYAGLDAGLDPEQAYWAYHRLLDKTHAREIRYKPATHVYPWVDLQPNLKLRSIYSGLEFDPEVIIREDLAIEAARQERLKEMLLAESGLDPEEALTLLEGQLPYNCEHVVPQSWFAKKEPMRGDLHHLFACESGCNSFRGNIPYWDFPDFEEVERRDCGKRVGKTKFEPEKGKGEVARAVLYFVLRYPGEIDDMESEYEEERIAILLGWHASHRVTDHERHRNQVIFRKQGNRNPLIDFPDRAGDIAFAAGLG
jgi:endonuclease G, mitochondrial